MPATDGKAELIATNAMKIPILTPGDLDMETVVNWDHACRRYFTIKEIKDNLRVIHASAGLQDMRIGEWYQTDQEYLGGLDWPDFIAEFKGRWLQPEWESTCNTLIRYRQRPTDSFKT